MDTPKPAVEISFNGTALQMLVDVATLLPTYGKIVVSIPMNRFSGLPAPQGKLCGGNDNNVTNNNNIIADIPASTNIDMSTIPETPRRSMPATASPSARSDSNPRALGVYKVNPIIAKKKYENRPVVIGPMHGVEHPRVTSLSKNMTFEWVLLDTPIARSVLSVVGKKRLINILLRGNRYKIEVQFFACLVIPYDSDPSTTTPIENIITIPTSDSDYPFGFDISGGQWRRVLVHPAIYGTEREAEMKEKAAILRKDNGNPTPYQYFNNMSPYNPGPISGKHTYAISNFHSYDPKTRKYMVKYAGWSIHSDPDPTWVGPNDMGDAFAAFRLEYWSRCQH